MLKKEIVNKIIDMKKSYSNIDSKIFDAFEDLPSGSYKIPFEMDNQKFIQIESRKYSLEIYAIEPYKLPILPIEPFTFEGYDRVCRFEMLLPKIIEALEKIVQVQRQ